MIDFNGMLTCLVLFYTKKLENHFNICILRGLRGFFAHSPIEYESFFFNRSI